VGVGLSEKADQVFAECGVGGHGAVSLS
jgi:hypothetical protein